MYVLFCCAQQPALLQYAKAIYRTKQYNTYVSLELNMGKICRVPTQPGKPGKMRVHLENLEISWNFEKFNKYHGKMT